MKNILRVERYVCDVCKRESWALGFEDSKPCDISYPESNRGALARFVETGHSLDECRTESHGRTYYRCPGRSIPRPVAEAPLGGQKLTGWREHRDDRYKLRTRVEYGFDTRLAVSVRQEPYFAITYTTDSRPLTGGRWSDDSGGCGEEPIREHFSNLAELLPFHLWGIRSGPMHYIDNARFHAGLGQYGKRNVDYFKSTIGYGLAGRHDNSETGRRILAEVEAGTVSDEELVQWLRERLPEAMEKFHEAMIRHGLMIVRTLDDCGVPVEDGEGE